ncbi:hypothetical protein [Actinokineospora cianjurensis]|uniref:hypothetical protein n=1 Tax=Actinokineospora cianjurensis TaxID=585224 RepID=UPI0011C395CA|nr:hypothetical protein [Actinokineospora cianjurensis]
MSTSPPTRQTPTTTPPAGHDQGWLAGRRGRRGPAVAALLAAEPWPTGLHVARDPPSADHPAASTAAPSSA